MKDKLAWAFLFAAIVFLIWSFYHFGLYWRYPGMHSGLKFWP